jgi:hypothetical protein
MDRTPKQAAGAHNLPVAAPQVDGFAWGNAVRIQHAFRPWTQSATPDMSATNVVLASRTCSKMKKWKTGLNVGLNVPKSFVTSVDLDQIAYVQ